MSLLDKIIGLFSRKTAPAVLTGGQAAQKLKAFYGGVFTFATKNPVGSQVTKGALTYFLQRIFR